MSGEDERLSQMQTLWTNMFTSAHPLETISTIPGPPRDLVLRYYGAVYRYILGMARDPDLAMELAQEFAGRFLRGDFMKADPSRGRFRDFLKVSVRNLVMDHYRKQQAAKQRGLRQFGADESEPGDEARRRADDEAFVSSFREEVMARTWEALAEAEKVSGKPFHTVLRFKIQHPELNSSAMAAEMSARLGKPMSDMAVRQVLHRARSQFADLLLDEVCRTLGKASIDELTQELVELRLLDYCKSALDRRAKQTQAE